jgi:type IV pilus assembly protein PilW
MGAAVKRPQAGFTLIEIMVSMVLGLVIIGGATSLILANQQSYRTNEALSQVQESARTAFELLSRDVREAGISGCDNTNRMANVLETDGGIAWWQTWFGMAGYEGGEVNPAVPIGTAPAERVADTDSMILQGIQGLGLTVEDHEPISSNFKINATTTDFVDDDILVVCDFDHAVILQVTDYNASNVTVVHNAGGGVSSPGNCSKGMGYPTDCSDIAGNVYRFERNSQVARFAAVAWYIGNNGRPDEGGRSLYRRRLGAGAAIFTEEVVAGVTDMELSYREDGVDEFVDANLVGDWWNVNAVMIALTVQSADRRVSSDVAVNAGRIQRRFTNIVTLRNRVP